MTWGDRPKIRESEILKVSPGDLEIGPEWRGLRRHGDGEGGSETGPEAGDLETWGGESGQVGEGGLRGGGGVGAAGFQKTSFSESGHWII
jgi:hypothetical protein